MRTVRIWALESDYDAKAIECLANKLKSFLQLGDLRIEMSGASTLTEFQARSRKLAPRRARRTGTSESLLSQATHNYLKHEICVIFVIDQDSPSSLHQRRQEPNSLINQIESVMNERGLAGKVFLVLAVQELEAWLLVDCLGIFCYFASQRTQYRENCRQKVSTHRQLSRLVNRYQKGNTETIVEAEVGGHGPKEYLSEFSEEVLLKLNPNMPNRNVKKQRYQETLSAEMAEHVEINRQTLRRNSSLRKLGEVLAQFN